MSFTVLRWQWCDEAQAGLEPAAYGDMAIIRDQVQQGISQLWRVQGSSDGWVVTRTETGLRELVLVVGAGRNCRPVLRHFMERAAAAGYSVRAHIRRPGMQRIYEGLGFFERERVMGWCHGRS